MIPYRKHFNGWKFSRPVLLSLRSHNPGQYETQESDPASHIKKEKIGTDQ
jgi:hypothetical protein